MARIAGRCFTTDSFGYGFYGAVDAAGALAGFRRTVVEEALATAVNGNVFLGGHSAGTGYTAARYAATDFNLSGGEPVPGFRKLRGLILLEGPGGSSNAEAPVPMRQTLDSDRGAL